MPVNYRYDEFTGEDEAILIEGEVLTVPSSGKPYVALAELPRQDSPSSLIVSTAGASTTTETSEDTYIQSLSPSANHEGSAYNAAGKADLGTYHGELFRTLVKWDLTSLPAVASVAKVRMYRLNVAGAFTSFRICNVTSPWLEGVVTWGTKPTFNPVPISSVNITQPEGWYEWDVTDWYNAVQAATLTNHGLQVMSDEVAAGVVSNWVARSGEAGKHPQLVVVGAGDQLVELAYNVPPAAGQFAVHYGTGRLRLHPSAAGDTLNADYMGTGSPIDVGDL